jgi:hypothetical protein
VTRDKSEAVVKQRQVLQRRRPERALAKSGDRPRAVEERRSPPCSRRAKIAPVQSKSGDRSRAVAADQEGTVRQGNWLAAFVARKPASVYRYTCEAGHAGSAAAYRELGTTGQRGCPASPYRSVAVHMNSNAVRARSDIRTLMSPSKSSSFSESSEGRAGC